MQKDYYQLLEVDPRASEDVIRKAYRVLAARHHPDVTGDPKDAERMRLVNEAYGTLMDPKRRAAYDRTRLQNVVIVFYEEGLAGMAKRWWRREGMRF